MIHPFLPGTRGAKVLFVVATVVLSTATHWPDLHIDTSVVDRPDLVIHLTAFWLWTTLLLRSGLLAPVGTKRALSLGAGVAVVFVSIDEVTQAFVPGRTVAWSDWLANLGGVTLGLLTSRLFGARPVAAQGEADR